MESSPPPKLEGRRRSKTSSRAPKWHSLLLCWRRMPSSSLSSSLTSHIQKSIGMLTCHSSD
ncbi:hypothetical protein SAY86_023166 [Trapa natans]|uniref:Uncharacterized protein n=1 Tax=Trapa natans TaxID=22666 RepID=A0AAN7LU28_TRANT|nr:hypothetical protein SAY86_023166 [Trapa natans]